MLICSYCGKECKNANSHRTHEYACPSNENRRYRNGMTGKPGSNQFIKAKMEGYPVPSVLDSTKTKISIANKGRKHSEKSKKLLSDHAKRNNLGGHTSKKALYFEKKNGEIVYLQSSYEVRFATLLEEMGIDWSRPLPLIWIDSDGVDHRYYPDFKIGDIYFDTKNSYLAIKDLPKINAVKKQANVDLRIVLESDITKEYILKAL